MVFYLHSSAENADIFSDNEIHIGILCHLEREQFDRRVKFTGFLKYEKSM